MTAISVSRRALLATLPAVCIVSAASAQDVETARAWASATALIWSEILHVPVDLLTTGGLSTHRRATNQQDLAEMHARAAAGRAGIEAEVDRCRAMMRAAPPPPTMLHSWEDTIVDRTLRDQAQALERLAAMAVFLEANSNRFAGGEAPFAAAMRLANWTLFGESDWIMACCVKLERLTVAPDSFLDLWHRATSLDWLASSINRTAIIGIVRGDPPEHLAEAQAALGRVSAEMRQISSAFATVGLQGLSGEGRARVRPLLPRLSALAAEQAKALDEAARAWPSLTPAQLIAEGAEFDNAPSFVQAAGRLVGDVLQPT